LHRTINEGVEILTYADNSRAKQAFL